MAKFEIANVMVDLGGDRGNQVPKYDVTPSEIAVLREIHGEEAVHDIEPRGFKEDQHAFERRRLVEFYGIDSPVVRLFPGNAPRMVERIADLDLPEEFFKAITRVAPAPAVDPEIEPDEEPTPAVDPEIEPDEEPTPVAEATPVEVEEEDDGISDMPAPPKAEPKHKAVRKPKGDIFS